MTQPDHWAFAGTGLGEGDEFGREDSIVGVECGRRLTSNSRMGNRDLQATMESVRTTKSSRSGTRRDHGFNADLGVHQDRFYATVAVNETEFKGDCLHGGNHRVGARSLPERRSQWHRSRAMS